jgi:hypothetical protein
MGLSEPVTLLIWIKFRHDKIAPLLPLVVGVWTSLDRVEPFFWPKGKIFRKFSVHAETFY